MVRILSDSTCDLSPELIRQYNIAIIPLYVHLGDREYRDGVDIRPEEIFRWSDENSQTPRTAAPDIEEISTYLDRDGKDEYVVFTISSSMSSSFSNCRLTAMEMGMEDRVFVIDSGNLSTGIGLLAIRAALMAREGMSGSQIASEIEKIKDKVRASFVVDTLTYLHRGGRCGGLAALAGSVLRLHPKIHVKDGVMGAGKKYRGKYSDIILNYAKEMEEELLRAKPDRVFVTHPPCDSKVVDSVCEYLKGLNHFAEVLDTEAGGVISSHCGPGTLGVLYIEGE
jgi:DegV family protein with EDD domain